MSAKDDCKKLIQEFVMLRDPICVEPGCGAPSDCGHHLFKRDRWTTAFLPEACVGVCTRSHTGWSHGKPEDFKKFMIARLGETRYYELRRLSYQDAKSLDYTKIREGLREMIASLKGEGRCR